MSECLCECVCVYVCVCARAQVYIYMCVCVGGGGMCVRVYTSLTTGSFSHRKLVRRDLTCEVYFACRINYLGKIGSSTPLPIPHPHVKTSRGRLAVRSQLVSIPNTTSLSTLSTRGSVVVGEKQHLLQMQFITGGLEQ